MTSHDVHVDKGGGYCACGAQLCSFPSCDGWCVHRDGWVELEELDAWRADNLRKQMQAAADGGWVSVDRLMAEDDSFGQFRRAWLNSFDSDTQHKGT